MKSLCKLKKDDLREVLPKLAAAAPTSPFICKKCGRIAPEKDWLCKAVLISKVISEAQ